MQHIIKDFQHFIDFHAENLLALGHGLEENFKLLVDKPENNLDQYLSLDYEGTPLWFYFLSFDYSLFDYFKERIVLKTDWDYTLLFNVDYIESSDYFISKSKEFYFSTLTPFCPFDVFAQIFKHSVQSPPQMSDFSFPLLSFTNLYNKEKPTSSFFKYAKIKLDISSLGHIFHNNNILGVELIHEIFKYEETKNVFISQLSNARSDDFFELKINLFFLYPDSCPVSLHNKFNAQELHSFVTDIISHKKPVDKNLLFKIMDKEHLILAMTNQYFSQQELFSFIQNKEIRYHLFNYKFPDKQTPSTRYNKNKI